MIEVRPDFESIKNRTDCLPISFHSTFSLVYEKLKKWFSRFSLSVDSSIYNDLAIFYLLAAKKFLDHRNSTHLFRLVLSVHLMQKKLLRSSTFSPHLRHLEIRWIPTNLLFPFAHKPVLSCIIGFNVMDRYELFDEENVVLALQKHLPQLRLVKESSYSHTTQHKNFKIFYFEIEKKNGSSFSLVEQRLLKNNLEDKVKKSIQPLSPRIFMGLNEEETYKNILVLSHEMQSLYDLPQASIHLDQQSGKEIIFRVTLVHISPFHRFSLKERFIDSKFVSQRILTVRHIENHPIEAHIFRLHLPRNPSFLRSDGSLDFYSARQKVVSSITAAIGEFRDYNGGILLKQQELLQGFKEDFLEISTKDSEFLETFFYSIVPLEKQIVIRRETLSTLFNYFLENRKQKLPKGSIYTFQIYREEQQIFLVVQADDSSMTATISTVLQEQNFTKLDIAYNFIETIDGVFFNCLLAESENHTANSLVQTLQETLHKWQQKMKARQVLKIGIEHPVVSLDPRIGGDVSSSEVLRVLFEGLTRFNKDREVENAVAKTIEVSSDLKQYTFKLRSVLWNDGSPVTAYDFEYAWKKILSTDFNTSFAYMFYPIKNAKEAKEGLVSPDEIGIYVLDDRTLKVELNRPTSYFLQLTAHPLFSPVHRVIDQQHPQWPYECDKNYLCNGPFQLKMNQPNQGYRLVKNPFYWDLDHIALDQITFTQMNPAQAFEAFQKNEVDWIGNPFGSWQPFYAYGKKDKVVSFPNGYFCSAAFNTISPPFQNQKLRKAFSYAIQRTQMTNDCFLPLTPAFSPLLPHHHENHQSLFPDFDPDKARQLLQEALNELGLQKKDLPPLTLLYCEKGIREYTAQCLNKQFQECLGIECELQPLTWNSFVNKMTTGTFQIAILQWVSWVSDPLYTLNNFKLDDGINFSKWKNTEFQRLLDLSGLEVNPFQRSSYLLKAEEILINETPFIPLFYGPNQSLVKKNLHVVFNESSASYNTARSFYKEKV